MSNFQVNRQKIGLCRHSAGAARVAGNFEPKLVRERLNHYMKLRGDVVHRSRAVGNDTSIAHPVKKEDLERVISFLKELVRVTEGALP